MKKKLTVYGELKEAMLANKWSVVDLNWKTLRKHKISMPKLLKWELKQPSLNAKNVRRSPSARSFRSQG